MTNARQLIEVSLIFTVVTSLAACSMNKPRPQIRPDNDVVRICDSNGCNDRPKSYAAPNPDYKQLDPDPDGRIAALETLAQQDPKAAYDLSLRYFRGDGVRQDSYQSVKWMRQAAERGDLAAQKALGRLYLTGLGEMGADYAEAHKWLSITASRGDKEAARLLDEVGEAKESQQAQNLAYSRWHSRFYNLLNSGYPYFWYWRLGGWYLY